MPVALGQASEDPRPRLFAGFRFYNRKSLHRWHPEQFVGGVGLRRQGESFFPASHVGGRGHGLTAQLCLFELAHLRHVFRIAEVRPRVAVTIEAPTHRERLLLRHRLHLIDATVAGRAADAGGDVRAVIEEGEVRDLVDLHPLDRLVVVRPRLADRLERFAVLLHVRARPAVAVHARLDGRNSGERAFLDGPVAVAAVHPHVAGVQLVAVGDGLFGRVPDGEVLVGAVVPKARDDRGAQRAEAEEDSDGEHSVRPLRE